MKKDEKTQPKIGAQVRLSEEELAQEEAFRTARVTGAYDKIWQTVGRCVFCDHDTTQKHHEIYEENGVYMTVPGYAYVDGHLLVIPRRHIRSVKELTPLEWETMRKMFYVAKKMIRETYGVKGMQIVQKDGVDAQSTVEHLHFHCVPFDSPDLSVWNYRELANTPYENAELYRANQKKMRKLFERFDEKYTTTSPHSTNIAALYKNALSQALANKKLSQANKSAKVGASIIAGDTIISRCNASLTDGTMEEEKDGKWVSPPTVSHAEERCITAAAQDGVALKGATMIVTLSPCMACSRLIANSGIRELHYIHDWWDQNALQFLADKGVTIRKLKPIKQEETR